MSDTTTRPADLAALAAELERLTRRVDALAGEVDNAHQNADQAHRVIVDVADRLTDLANQHTSTGTGTGEADQPPQVPAWLTVTDADTAAAMLADLVDWLGRVFVHYPGAADALGECWPWHPAVVEELHTLRLTWHAAHHGPTASARAAADWHDRYLPGTIRRLRTTLGDCSRTAHQPGERAHRPAPDVPATDAVDQLATWWATDHGTSPPPAL